MSEEGDVAQKTKEDGAKANSSGKAYEEVIYSLLDSKGIRYQRQVRLPVTSIYGRRIRVDALIKPYQRVPAGLIIEGKWQDSTGTAEEKLPYLVMNIKRKYPYPTIIVIDGHGFTGGAMAWVRNEVDDDKLVAVFSTKEFISWCNREL